MRKSTLIWFVLLICLATVLLAFAQDAGPQPSQIGIDIRDYCDPTTFNAVIGPGTCVRSSRPVPSPFPASLPSSCAINLLVPGGSFPTKFVRMEAQR